MLFSPHPVKKDAITKEFYSLGTIIQFKVYGNRAKRAIDKATDKIKDIDNKMSVFKGYSELSKINHNAGIRAAKVDKDTYFVIKKAVEYSALSGGAFDPTIRPVVGLWGIQTDHARIPSNDEIDERIKLVNYKDIILDEKYSSIMLKREKQELDVGAIAKGFAADEVKNIFKSNKIESAIIDLGGNIFAMGNKIDGTPWNIGIQDPLKSRGETALIVSVKNKSVVTSGNYERYFIRGGKRFHHIIDPLTGNPSEKGILSTTIVSDHSIDGDALSTCAYVMGLDRGMALIESIKGVDAIFITENKMIYTTSGIKENFELLNNNFYYKN